MRYLGLGLALSAVLASVGCASESDEAGPAKPAPTELPKADATPAPIGTSTSALTQTSCRYIIPKSVEGTKVVCYDLQVQENRRNAGANKTITIHLARIKGKEGGIPTVELIGGPGGGGDDIVGGIVAGASDLVTAYGPILAKGDLVVFDQRGIGRSIPRLNCNMDVRGNPITKCKSALEAQGIDVAAYDTIENADDVHDMKVALGVDKIDLHGISYGTRLALEILKRHADDVHAAIIDGVMPPDVPVMGMFPVAMDSILTRTFNACKADTKCNTTYPDLEGTLTKLKAKLDKTPFQAVDPQYPDEGSYPYDWFAFTQDLVEQSYSEGTAARVPFWISSLVGQTQAEFADAQKKAAADDDAYFAAEDAEAAKNPLFKELLTAMQNTTPEDNEAMQMAEGMYLSVTCNDYAQHEKIDTAKIAQSKIRVALQDDEGLAQEFGDCTDWPTRPSDPTVQNPATYGGPVLVIGGDEDPATPVEWAKHAAASLPVNTFVEVPTGGHGLMDACGAGLKGGFFADPSTKLDATCATNRKLDFFYDTKTATHTLANHGSLLGSRTLLATRPAESLTERISQRVLAAARPAVVTNAVKSFKKLAARVH